MAAISTAVLLLAGGFAVPRFFFFFELAKSSIYFAIAALVYYSNDRLGYMLGIIVLPLWFTARILHRLRFVFGWTRVPSSTSLLGCRITSALSASPPEISASY